MADVDFFQESLNSINDEETLYKLLDNTEDFDVRKKIRARLRDVQTEQRAKRDEMMKKREQEREDAIRQRQKDAADQKKRTLAMYDQMAKSGKAGENKTMDINIYKNTTSENTVTIETTEKRDLVEEGIQQRKREAEERKKNILAAYDTCAKSGPAGSPRYVDFNAAQKKPANGQMSAKAKFQQMDQKVQGGKPTATRVTRSATDIKDMLLQWCKSKTKDYQNVDIQNFSTSWNDGMAFCALTHHFFPDAFEFDSLNPKNRRHNFDLAFRVADEKGGVAPLLDVDDMVALKKPDWKCVFCYIQSFYRKFHNVD